MSGQIDSNHFVEHMSGGFHGSPGVVAWSSGSGSTVVDGGFTNPFPGPPAFENQSSNGIWRAFHRSIRIANSVDGVVLFAWHRNVIYANDAPPNWSAVHTCTSQRTDASSRHGGDHTGLYAVMDRDGSTLWVVGFYRTTSDTIGIVKYNTLTDTWSSFDSGEGFHDTAFSLCTQWSGQLAHAGNDGGELLLFDPQTNALQIFNYPGNRKDWIHQLQGRLFIASKSSGNLRLLEFVAGGFYNHGTVTGTTENTTDQGGWSIIPYTDEVLYIVYYTTTGGTGWRCEKVAVTTTIPGDAVTMSDLTSIIPDGSDLLVGDYSWPTGGASQDIQQFLPGLDCTEWPRGAFGTSGGIFGGFHISAPVSAPDKFTATHDNVQWNGEGSPINRGSPGVATDMFGYYSYPLSRWGRGTKDLSGGTGPWIESINRYSDSVVSRGILIRFRHHGYGGSKDWQVLFGYPVAKYSGPGITPCSLSLGEGIDPGGVATLNTVGTGGDSLDEVWGEFFDSGTPQALLNHDVPSSGPGFSVSENITGPSGAGTVLAVNATRNRIIVRITSGSFSNGETISGGSSSTTAMLTEDQDIDPLYQVIWDIGADSIPDNVFVELSTVTIPNGTSRPPGNFGGYVTGPVQQSYTADIEESFLTFSGGEVVADANANTSSEVEEPVVLTDSVPPTSSGDVGEPGALTDNAPPISSSEIELPFVETDNVPSTAISVTERPFTKPGGLIGFQEDGVEIGTRIDISFNDNTYPNQSLNFTLPLPDGPGIEHRISNSVEIGRASLDAVNNSLGLSVLVSNLENDGFDSVTVEKAVIVATDVSNVTNQPIISVGTNLDITAELSYDNQIESTELVLTDANQSQDIFASNPSKMAKANDLDSIFVQLDKKAMATTYMIDIIVYGYVEVA